MEGPLPSKAGIAALDDQCGDNDRDSDDNRRKDQLIR